MRFQFRIPNAGSTDSGHREVLREHNVLSHDRVVIPTKVGTPFPSIFIFATILSISILTALPLTVQSQSTFTDSRDGHVYPTVIIGGQTWMAGNLAWLPEVNRVSTGLFEEECHYVYGYDGTDTNAAKKNENFDLYGVLYNWMAAKSACPEGWHLPTDREWMALEKKLGMNDTDLFLRDWRTSGSAGTKIKSTTGWINGNSTNESGFNAQAGGCRGYAGFESQGYATYFWTASTIDGDNGWRRGICSDSQGISRQEDRRYFGCSVRCVKNEQH